MNIWTLATNAQLSIYRRNSADIIEPLKRQIAANNYNSSANDFGRNRKRRLTPPPPPPRRSTTAAVAPLKLNGVLLLARGDRHSASVAVSPPISPIGSVEAPLLDIVVVNSLVRKTAHKHHGIRGEASSRLIFFLAVHCCCAFQLIYTYYYNSSTNALLC